MSDNAEYPPWGEWEPQFFPSGTTVVSLKGRHRKPNLYIYADVGIDEDRTQRDRYEMCRQLADFLNGGDRPDWLTDFHRLGEVRLDSLAGASISATGPSVDRDPPNLDWVQDDSREAQRDRARLIDYVSHSYKRKIKS